MLIAYNLLRHEIARMAGELQVPPQRLSFQWLALAITTACTTAFANPGHLSQAAGTAA